MAEKPAPPSPGTRDAPTAAAPVTQDLFAAPGAPDAAADDVPADFEALLGELDATVKRLESGQLSLEDSLAAFERGMRLSKKASTILDAAEARVEELTKRDDGSASTRPFEG